MPSGEGNNEVTPSPCGAESPNGMWDGSSQRILNCAHLVKDGIFRADSVRPWFPDSFKKSHITIK